MNAKKSIQILQSDVKKLQKLDKNKDFLEVDKVFKDGINDIMRFDDDCLASAFKDKKFKDSDPKVHAHTATDAYDKDRKARHLQWSCNVMSSGMPNGKVVIAPKLRKLYKLTYHDCYLSMTRQNKGIPAAIVFYPDGHSSANMNAYWSYDLVESKVAAEALKAGLARMSDLSDYTDVDTKTAERYLRGEI